MTSLLHRAVWRNDLEGLTELLTQEPSHLHLPDAESGWTPLHRALYYGHLRAAGRLLKEGGRLDVEDTEGRTPLELVTKELQGTEDAKTDVLSWGSGMNFQLGTGNTGMQQMPRRVETLAGGRVVDLAASKFHSMALSREGKVYTWGWGLGGRLGHPDVKLHTENSAQIFPRMVEELCSKKVVSIAAAKHHSLAVMANGDVYSWGLMRDGRLGYISAGKKQVTPKRIVALKGVHVIQAAAANKHSAVVSDGGAVYTWGSNFHGQLGYGTTDSASNPTPRCVEVLKHKSVSYVSVAKRHTLALTKDGEVFAWGHKRVAPKRVILTGSREAESKNRAGAPIQFHRGFQKVKKPIAVTIAAGAFRSYCVTTMGVVLWWNSDAVQPAVQEVGGKLSGKKAVSISAGKTATAVTMQDGRVYYWNTKTQKDVVFPELVQGMKGAAFVAVGEIHSLVLQKWHAGPIPSLTNVVAGSVVSDAAESETTMLSSYVSFPSDWEQDNESNVFKCLSQQSKTKKESEPTGGLLSLQLICEKAVAENNLDPRNALQFFRHADTIGAGLLKNCTLQLIVRNLALVLRETHETFADLSDDLLLEIEQSYQREVLQTNTSNVAWWVQTERLENVNDMVSRRPTYLSESSSHSVSSSVAGSTFEQTSLIAMTSENRFLPNQQTAQNAKKKKLQQKLHQIRVLIEKQARGDVLDKWQLAKIARQGVYEKALASISQNAPYDETRQQMKEKPSARCKVPKDIQVKKLNKEQVTTKPQKSEISPNLRPVVSVIPRSRDVGHLPRFLEPCRKNTQSVPQTSAKKPSDPSTDVPPREDSVATQAPVKERKWVKLELQSLSKPETSNKAIPTKETRKMSLSDFMTARPPSPPLVKESVPAWGGLHFRKESSFQSIQEEQRNHRPGMIVEGGGIKPAVERRRTVSRWQTHSDVQIQSINCIQIEEKAVQELAALYKGATVKVKPGTARETKTRKP